MRRDWSKKTVLCLWIFLSLFLASCGWSRREQIQRERDYAADQAKTELEAGRFQRAIDLCEELRQKYPQDPDVRSRSILTLEAVKSGGDRAFERNDFETARNIYEILGKNWSHFADLAPALSFKRDYLEKRAKTSRCLFVGGQVSSYVKAGEFQKAVDLCKEIYQKYPRDPSVRSSYIQILETIKGTGDRAFERNDFEMAGSVYELLLKHIPSVTRLNGSSPLDREGLTVKIKACVKNLFENGLQQYRTGNLDQAISIWKGILAFDPGNEEVKRAVDMASLQLKNLRKAK
jgi:tetratricopeptide (TPR) repeat protein